MIVGTGGYDAQGDPRELLREGKGVPGSSRERAKGKGREKRVGGGGDCKGGSRSRRVTNQWRMVG